MQDYRTLQELSNEELVAKYQITHNEVIFNTILSKNDGLIHQFALSYNIPNNDIEDLVSEGYIALMYAVERFSPEKGVTFTTFLKINVQQQLNRLYNEATRKKRFTGSTPISYEGLQEINKEGGTEVNTSFTIECEDYTQIEINSCIELLTDKERFIAVSLMNGYSCSDCAKALSCTCATVTYYIRRIRKSLRSYKEAV